MVKKMFVAVLVASTFIVGYMLPRRNVIKKGQAYRAGNYIIYYRTYKGIDGKTFQKIDIQGKHKLIGGIYKKGATIEEKR